MNKELKRMASNFAGNRELGADHCCQQFKPELFMKKILIPILTFFCSACANPDAITISKERHQKLLNGDTSSLKYPKKFFIKDCWGCGSISEKQFQIILGSDGHEYIESNEYHSYILIHSPECIKCKKDTIK